MEKNTKNNPGWLSAGVRVDGQNHGVVNDNADNSRSNFNKFGHGRPSHGPNNERRETVGGRIINGDNNGYSSNVDPGYGHGTHVTGHNNGYLSNIGINHPSRVRVEGDNNGTIDNSSGSTSAMFRNFMNFFYPNSGNSNSNQMQHQNNDHFGNKEQNSSPSAGVGGFNGGVYVKGNNSGCINNDKPL
uniref:Wingless n=1 Tax=Panagrolaimus sp. ES5 TaxID=591445 RepID=A0AC34GWJ2_9BILA